MPFHTFGTEMNLINTKWNFYYNGSFYEILIKNHKFQKCYGVNFVKVANFMVRPINVANGKGCIQQSTASRRAFNNSYLIVNTVISIALMKLLYSIVLHIQMINEQKRPIHTAHNLHSTLSINGTKICIALFQ